MTNPIASLAALIESQVLASPMSTIVGAGWIDSGIPDPAGPYPCVRIDGLQCLDDKLDRYMANIKLFDRDTSSGFYDTAEAFRRAISSSPSIQVQVQGYIDRPDTGFSCALFPVTFTA